MEEAEVVDVISTRFHMAKSEKAKKEAVDEGLRANKERGRPLLIVRPLHHGRQREEGARGWREVQRGDGKVGKDSRSGVIVFNPNTDNALSMKGDPEAANAIWLLNWRKALVRAKKTGGRMIQIIVRAPVCLKCRRRRRAWRRIRASRL